MEDIANDFLSPADDDDLSSDFFNSEPFYYDAYYDSYDEQEGAGMSEVSESTPASPELLKENSLTPEESDALPIHDALDLRLLGADLQSELKFVLEQLTNGSQRNRRHQTPIRVSGRDECDNLVP